MSHQGHLPVVAIVGRPNVGKSTLFNRILGRRKAVVLDTPGVTRDRNYAVAEWNNRPFLLVDTGGYDIEDTAELVTLVREQCMLAIEEADAVVFVVDLRQGITPMDQDMADMLRRTGKAVFLAVNKADSPMHEEMAAEFYAFGLDRLYAVSAEHARHISDLMDDVMEVLPPTEAEEEPADRPIKIAVVGRQNVGKSTLVNSLTGEQRVIASEVPGTTRDAIDTYFERGDGRRYILIDTAGIRRRGKIQRGVERLSVTSAIVSLERCDVALLVLDASSGIVEQDAHIAGYAQEAGRAVVILVNKWDAMEKDYKTADHYIQYVRDELKFLAFAPIMFISAKSGRRVERILDTVDALIPQYRARIDTPTVNNALQDALRKHSPPVMSGRALKIKYVVQTSTAPPTFTLFVNDPKLMHFSYERYLLNQFHEAFNLTSVPIRLKMRKKA